MDLSCSYTRWRGLFLVGIPISDMSDQQYVYTTHAMEVREKKMGDIESVVSEYARQGWRLAETMERDGTTIGLVFEREV